MSFDLNAGGKALGARFAGLGVATALALTITVAPSVALAEGETTPETSAVETTNEVVTSESTVETKTETPAPETTTVTPVVETKTETPAPETTTETPVVTDTKTETPVVTDTKTEADAAAEIPEVTPATEATATEATATEATETKAETETPAPAAEAVAAAEIPEVAPVVATPAPAASAETSSEAPAQTQANGDKVVNAQNIYRLYNPQTDEHLYTKDYNEAMSIAANLGWQYEGIGYTTSATDGTPVYRLYNTVDKLHLWTTDANEYKTLLSRGGWNDEHIAWYGAGPSNVMRLYNAATKQHLYTSDQNEVNILSTQRGWTRENSAGVWAISDTKLSIPGNWLISGSWTGQSERYWIGSDGNVAKNRYVDPDNWNDRNAGYKAYAKPDGAIARGTWKVNSDHVMLADNDGRIRGAGKNGWVITDEWFDDSFSTGNSRGEEVKHSANLHRYWFDNGLARIGLFKVDGALYYGFEGTGFVATGTGLTDNGTTTFGVGDTVYTADRDGKLTVDNSYRHLGYTVANKYGSPTNYFISVDFNNRRVMVFQKYTNKDPWTMVMESLCGLGKNGPDGETYTFMGYNDIKSKRLMKWGGYEYCRYESTYAGSGNDNQSFHGLLYYCSNGEVSEGELGVYNSAGCIRLPDEKAGFIYYMVPLGTTKMTYAL